MRVKITIEAEVDFGDEKIENEGVGLAAVIKDMKSYLNATYDSTSEFGYNYTNVTVEAAEL